MTKRILLKENESRANVEIKEYSDAYEKGKRLLAMLKNLGYEVQRVDNWETVEQHFTKDYPKATLSFNLNANGIEAEYLAAKDFHHRGGLSFEALTVDKQEAIREKNRIYAETDKQIEAYNLMHRITDDLNKLESLGVKMVYSQSYLIDKVFSYDWRRPDLLKTEVNQAKLIDLLRYLK